MASTTTSLETSVETFTGEVMNINGIDGTLGTVVPNTGLLQPDGSLNTSVIDSTPLMSSNINGATTVSGSVETLPAFNAFDNDGDISNGWVSSGNTTGWLQRTQGSEIINKYTLQADGVFLSRMAKDWTLRGSTDNFSSSDDILDTRVNVIGWVDDTPQTFTFTNSTAYTSYRIDITANNGDSNLSIAEMELIEAVLDRTIYTSDITSYGLSEVPSKVYREGGEDLTFTSSTTTEYVGTSTKSGMLADGDTIQLDGTTDVVCSSIVESTSLEDSSNIHDIFNDNSTSATYILDGNSNDLGGNYNGTDTNITYTSGKFGDCASFNDSDSSIDTNTNSFGSLNTQNYSISVWANTNNIVNYTNQVISSDTTDVDFHHLIMGRLGVSTYGVGFRDRASGQGGSDFQYSTTINTGQWYHIVITRTGADFTMYLDGVLVSTDTSTTATGSDGNVLIGRQARSSVSFDGKIDQVRIFNRALNQTEVDSLYVEEVLLPQYTCTFPVQASAPTSAKVLDRTTTPVEESDVFDGIDTFTKTYELEEVSGALATNYKVTSDTGTEISQFNMDLNKEPTA